MLVLLGGMNLRGTDQYWYIADTETILAGSPWAAQHVFPQQVVQPNFPGYANFVHNALGMYLVLPMSWVTGPLMGWVLTNIVLAIAAAVVVWAIVRRAANTSAANAAFCLTLVYPASFWQASQPLLESSCMIFTALAAWFFLKAEERHWNWWALGFSLAALTLCRISYLPVLAALPAVYLAYQPSLTRRHFATVGAMLILTVGTFIFSKWALPNGMPTSLRMLIANGKLPELDYMRFLYITGAEPILLENVIGKATVSFVRQFPLNQSAIYYWPFNFAAITAIVGLFSSPHGGIQRRLCLLATGILSVHCLQGVIHQNQFRYLVPGWPVILAAAVITWNFWFASLPTGRTLSGRLLRYSGRFAIALCCVVDLALTVHLVRVGEQEARGREMIRAQMAKHIPVDATILLDCGETRSVGMYLEFISRPRRIVYMRESVPADDCRRIVEGFRPTYVIASNPEPYRQRVNGELVEVSMNWPKHVDEMHIYRVVPQSLQTASRVADDASL